MIRTFSCRNFRNVNAEKLKFNRINILIGPNNSGKTNFIRALSFCADMVNNSEKLIGDSSFLTLAYRYGAADIFNKFSGALNREITMQWEIHLGSHEDVRYELGFRTGTQLKDFLITKERLDSTRKRAGEKRPFNYFTCQEKPGTGYISKAVMVGEQNSRMRFEIPNNDTVLRQFDQIRLDNKEIYENSSRQVDMIQRLNRYFQKYYFYSSSQFDLKRTREPQPVQADGKILEKDGSNFVNVFNYYKNENIYNSINFLEKLKELMPTLDSADVIAEFNKLIFKVGYEGKQFNLNDLSDGTIKAMLLALLIHVPVNNGFSMLAIDEPEMNIHPAWQQILGRWIQYSNNFEQCFISTHSPDFLDTFTEGFKRGDVSVFVFDPREEVLIRKLQYSELKEELQDWELGDLYRVNDPSVGGWPW